MASTILLKRRSSDNTDPSGLSAGEIAANIHANGKKLYVGDGTGNIIFVDKDYVDAAFSNALSTTETKTLTSGQTIVTFSGAIDYAAFYISGDDADNGRLVLGTDFTLNAATKTITLTVSYPAGTKVTAVHYDSVSNQQTSVNVDKFIGDGSTTGYTLTTSISNENNTAVYVDGIYQSKDNYTAIGTAFTFSTAPPLNAPIEIIAYNETYAAGGGQVYVDEFTANGVTASYTLSATPSSADSVQVYLNGIYQNKTSYTVTGAVLALSEIPELNSLVEAVLLSEVTVSVGVPTNGTVTSASLAGNLTTPGDLTVTGTLSATPDIENQTLSNGQTVVVFTNSIVNAKFYISGPDVDNGLLLPTIDYTSNTGTKTVTLTESYPANTRLSAIVG